jgi:hypothetical protein
MYFHWKRIYFRDFELINVMLQTEKKLSETTLTFSANNLEWGQRVLSFQYEDEKQYIFWYLLRQ